jgi:hypothetical protein
MHGRDLRLRLLVSVFTLYVNTSAMSNLKHPYWKRPVGNNKEEWVTYNHFCRRLVRWYQDLQEGWYNSGQISRQEFEDGRILPHIPGIVQIEELKLSRRNFCVSGMVRTQPSA